MSEMTYGRIDELLRSLGFSVRVTADPPAKVYEHETGALIALPVFPNSETVLQRHMVAVRAILDTYGIADSSDLALPLPKS